MNNQKKKKRSEQILIDLEDKETQFDKLIDESIKILELTEREFNNSINNAEIKFNKSKRQIIEEAGKYLEKNLEIVKFNSPNQICKKLVEKFKGKITRTQIWYYCPENWKVPGRVSTGRRGGQSTQSNRLRLEVPSVENKPLTEHEKQMVDFHEKKVYHNEQIDSVIDYWLGLTEEEKTDIINSTPKGTDYRKIMIEKARNNILKIAKGLNDTDIAPFLADIRFLEEIHSVASDVLYHEQESRKRNKEMLAR